MFKVHTNKKTGILKLKNGKNRKNYTYTVSAKSIRTEKIFFKKTLL